MNGLLVHLALLALTLGFTSTQARCQGVVERDTIRKTLKFGAGVDERRIVVDNINGSIRVTGYNGNDVELIARQTIRADSPRNLERAQNEVTLDIREDHDRIIIYVDTPWRRTDGSSHYRGWDHEGYDVGYDFELRVPSKTDFILKTVNDGDVIVRNMQGKFQVSNVNGGVEMHQVAGAGKVTTVNGDVAVGFSRNPGSPVAFKTVNGEIEATFPSEPAADIRFKTMNGEVYTDFDVKSMPMRVRMKEKRGGKKVWGSGNSFMVQSAGGGPELSFNTLNGNIYLSLKGDRK